MVEHKLDPITRISPQGLIGSLVTHANLPAEFTDSNPRVWEGMEISDEFQPKKKLVFGFSRVEDRPEDLDLVCEKQ